MKIDEALDAVVNDSWDRDGFSGGHLTKQKRDVMVARISKMLRSASKSDLPWLAGPLS